MKIYNEEKEDRDVQEILRQEEIYKQEMDHYTGRMYGRSEIEHELSHGRRLDSFLSYGIY